MTNRSIVFRSSLLLAALVCSRAALASTITVPAGGTMPIPLSNYGSLSGMCNDSNGTAFDLGCVTASGSVTYTLNVQQAGTYAITLNYASPVSQTAASVLVNGVKAASIAFANTGGWIQYVSAAPVSITLPSGAVSLTIQAQSSGFNLGGITLAAGVPVITPTGNSNIPLQGYSSISGMCPDANGTSFDLGCVQPNGYAVYPVNVTQSGTYSITASYASPTGNTAASILVNNAAGGNVSFANSGGWSNYVNAAPITVTLPAGSVNLAVQAQSAGFNLGSLTVAPTASTPPATSAPPTTSTQPFPVAWWKFDQSSGTVATDSAGSANGSLLNGAAWTAGQSGNAIALGNSSYNSGGAVSLPMSLPSTFTLSFWAKANGYSNVANIENNVVMGGGVYQTNGFRAAFNGSGIFTFWTTESGGTLTLQDVQPAQVGTWNQYVIAYNNGAGALYRNGVLAATAAGTYASGASPTGINTAVGGVKTFWGAVDDVRVYNQALPGSLTNQFGSFGSTANQVLSTSTPSFAGVVPNTYFGMTIHSLAQPNTYGATSTTPFPAFAATTLRMWDVAYWQQIEPSSGQFNWTNMDKTILVGQQNGTKDFIFTLGHLPTWASSQPTDHSCSEGAGSCDFPNMTAFDDFLTRVVQRYCGSVKYYESWNEPDNPGFWNGTNSQLLTIASHVYRIVKDPSNCTINGSNPNQVLLPPVSSAGQQSLAWLASYLATAGSSYPYADVTTFHGYGYDNSPETITQGVTAFKQVVKQYGLGSLPIWNTEASWGVHNTAVAQEQDAAWLIRYHLAQASAGVSRFIWYAYDNCAWGPLWGSACNGSNQPLDSWSGIRAAGQAYATVEQWLVGQTLNKCDQYQNGMWSCQIQEQSGHTGWVVWSTSGNLSVQAPSGQKLVDYRDWQNVVHSFPGTLTVGTLPVLLEN